MATNVVDLDSSAVDYDEAGDLLADFDYRRNQISRLPNGRMRVTPKLHRYQFKTAMKPHKTGLMLVGIGGNNGTTVVGQSLHLIALIYTRHRQR